MPVKFRWNRHTTYCGTTRLPTTPHRPPPALTGPFPSCSSCPYPGHGFVCWSGNGQCMREFMKKLDKGAEENDDTSGTGQR